MKMVAINGQRRLLGPIGLLCAISVASAEPPAVKAPGPEASVLGGPHVSATARNGPATPLVELDFQGRLKRLDEQPVVAAVKTLKLDPATRAAVDAVITERVAATDALVLDNINLLVELTSAGAAAKNGSDKDQAALAPLLMKAATLLGTLNARGTLEMRVRAKLPPKDRAALDGLIRGYFDAVAADGVVDDGVVVRPGNRVECAIAENFRLVGKDIEASFQRILGQGDKEFEKILASLELRPEQEGAIRLMFEKLIVSSNYKPTQAQQTVAFLKVVDLLDPAQRRTFLRLIAESEGRGNARAKDGGSTPDTAAMESGMTEPKSVAPGK